jgi:hypothetical protein
VVQDGAGVKVVVRTAEVRDILTMRKRVIKNDGNLNSEAFEFCGNEGKQNKVSETKEG